MNDLVNKQNTRNTHIMKETKLSTITNTTCYRHYHYHHPFTVPSTITAIAASISLPLPALALPLPSPSPLFCTANVTSLVGITHKYNEIWRNKTVEFLPYINSILLQFPLEKRGINETCPEKKVKQLDGINQKTEGEKKYNK